MKSEDVRVPSAPGSHPTGHAASGVDGAPRFDPSRIAKAAERVARRQHGLGGLSQAHEALNLHPEEGVWRSSPFIRNIAWHKLADMGIVEGSSAESTLTPFGRAVRHYMRTTARHEDH